MPAPTYEELLAENRKLLAENARLSGEKRELASEAKKLEAQSAKLEAQSAKLEAQSAKLEAKSTKLEAKNAKLAKTAKSQAVLIDRLQDQVKSLLAQRYGRRSEKLTAEELGQLALAWGGKADDPEPKLPRIADDEGEPNESGGKKPNDENGRYKNGHPGRTALDESLERVVHEHEVPAEERTCSVCHHEMTTIRHVEHERIEYVPAKLVVHVDRREVLACREADCGAAVATAPREPPAAPRCRIGLSLLAHLVGAKCQDAQPIERQRDQLARLGCDIPVNTLYSAWNRGLDALRIIGDALLGDILSEWYVRLDDTRLSVLDRHRKGGQRRGHLWNFVGYSGRVAYYFTETWRAEEIAPVIEQIEGFAQVDDWKGYLTKIVDRHGHKRPLIYPERRLGCGMHTRRRFHEDHKLGGKGSAPALKFWHDLYAIEEHAKAKGLDPGQRYELRQEHSVPIMNAFDSWVDDMRARERPTSRLGKALHYAHQQRPYLRRCLTDGRFEIDNGEPERKIRQPAIGRKNWLFTGSNRGGRRLATAYSLVQTCRVLGIPVEEYLIDVWTKIEHGWPLQRLNELIPDRWAAAR